MNGCDIFESPWQLGQLGNLISFVLVLTILSKSKEYPYRLICDFSKQPLIISIVFNKITRCSGKSHYIR